MTTELSNVILNCSTLSAKDKGVYVYLYFKQNNKDWNFSIKAIAEDFRDGNDSINTAIANLVEQGLLSKHQSGVAQPVQWTLNKINGEKL